jgi:uncharacterized alkaline shock family protein YloU
MGEQEPRQHDSPLQSGRGSTTIEERVVSKIAGIAAGEVEGVRMGGSVSRSVGGIVQRVSGSQSQTPQGVSVEVGTTEAAIDVTMGVEYGRNIPQLAERVRRIVKSRVEDLTGLQATELNIEVDDVLFPDREKERRRGGRREGAGGLQSGGFTEAEVRERVRTEGKSGPVPDQEVHAKGVPVDEGETAKLRPGEDEVEKRSADEETSELRLGDDEGEDAAEREHRE